MAESLKLDFHGVGVEVRGNAALLEALRFDFAWFVRDQIARDVSLECHVAPPPWSLAPRAKCVLVQPNCVVFADGDCRWVDYQGRALCRFRYEDESGELWSEDEALAHEILYLLILSRVGERLDARGLHRVHALGLSVRDRGVLCLLPSGGGKTTLGLRALERADVSLLSDDTPLVGHDGTLYAFPVRIGTTQKPASAARFFRRHEREGKWLVDATAYRISDKAVPHALVLGFRQLRGEAALRRLGRPAAAVELFRSLVVGVGLPQVVEYFLRFDWADVARKSILVASRARAAAALLARAESHALDLSRDSDANFAALAELL